MKKPKVLIIAYYWPPSGGGGVHRWLKMSKYLVEFFDIYVYTPENPESPALDHSSLKEIHPDIKIVKSKIFEPYQLYKLFTGKNKNERIYSGFITKKKSLTQRISVWLRGNFFIPDARKWWIKPSIKYLEKFIKNENIEVVVSTGPPHSMHLIGQGVKKKWPNIKWIADFRDPWTHIDFYHQLRLSQWADSKHKRLEKEVLLSADDIVTVSHSWANDFKYLSGGREIKVIHNGFDHTDFNGKVESIQYSEILHVGSMNADRNPSVLWKALSKIRSQSVEGTIDWQVNLIGQVDHSIESDIALYNLENCVTIEDFIPHKKIIKRMQHAGILLLVINDVPSSSGIVPGKAYEYLGAQRPILVIGPQSGDCRDILEPFDHCTYIEYDQIDKCISFLKNVNLDGKAIEKDKSLQYSRKNLALQYSKLILN